MTRNDASLRQIAAARPDRSTWLSANAGSGKTKVLTDRVARLLLEGVDPQHILCLTYTKAAATEMQNRLFRRLGAWAMLRDDTLCAELSDLGLDGPLAPGTLADARRLFARAIETPGGLKIQTIHSFCAGLLRRFPLEAGVSPQFTEMEDRAAALLRAEIVEEIAAGPDAPILYAVARHHSGESLEDLTREIVSNRGVFDTCAPDQALMDRLNLPARATRERMLDQVFLGDEQELIERILPALRAGSKTDQGAAEVLSALRLPDEHALPQLEKLFLYGSSAKAGPFSAKLGAFPTKATRETLADLLPPLEDFMRRVEAARDMRLALTAADKARALHRFAALFLPAYDRAKQLRGWLDFDDLIHRAAGLLTRAEVAAWVLFRLDGGLDHILVDEAQDTSPQQWQVIERLAQEFTSGEGARPETRRTIFVVGDKKQSIYSFQGADPREFDRMRQEFQQRLAPTGDPLQSLQLDFSFRSAQAVLDLVDQTFLGNDQAGFSPDQSHIAFKHSLPGRVDLWPLLPAPAEPDEVPWHSPVDIPASNDPAVVLANRIADRIARMIEAGQAIPDDRIPADPWPWRRVQAGDFLILVQRRSALFHEIIRACKERGLPVAGADRLKVGAELAVRDLAALLAFLATPEDDLSLAVALKSPLLGWTEAQLYDLATGRKGYLWEALRKRATEFPETMAMIADLRGQVDYLRPYDLIERILTRHDGRRRLLARLGTEAEDGIDALLAQALAYEQKSVDSLTGFLVWLETDDLEIKRQMDSAGDRIRVMTAHGAKGLESPVVILPDTAKRPVTIRDDILADAGVALWKGRADQAPRAIADLTEAMKQAQQAERDRLLYVAMTRAEKWLIVASPGDPGEGDDSWYSKVRRGMERCGAAEHDFDGGSGLRLEQGIWAETETDFVSRSARPPITLDRLFDQAAPPPPAAPQTLSPSDLGGAKALPGEQGLDEDAAKRRGRQVHLLLEFLPDLPQVDWPAIAARLLNQGDDQAGPEECALLLAEVGKVLTKPSLAGVFATEALREVDVTAALPSLDGRRVHGTIDRLILEPGRILIVDFKTNALVPDGPETCPDGLLRQMGAYAEAVAQIYPDRRIDTAILWTRTAQIMMLPNDIVKAALADTPRLDVPRPAT